MGTRVWLKGSDPIETSNVLIEIEKILGNEDPLLRKFASLFILPQPEKEKFYDADTGGTTVTVRSPAPADQEVEVLESEI